MGLIVLEDIYEYCLGVFRYDNWQILVLMVFTKIVEAHKSFSPNLKVSLLRG